MLRANMTPPVNYRRLHKLTDISLLHRQLLAPIESVIVRNVLLIVCPWKANTTFPRNAQYRVMHNAIHKVNSHHSGMAWKAAIAATTRNAISEAMNVLHERENKV